MNRTTDFPSRRRFLAASAAGSAWLMQGCNVSAQAAARVRPDSPIDPDGPSAPYPIPWLDKNGSHNQPAGPNLEPSHIYHFKGHVARCSTFTGAGTDNQGNRIAFGSAATDYGVMQGEYWAGRAAQQGTFTHI